jgi:hypothetical protein
MVGMTMSMDDELARLRAGNTRLIALLDAHSIAWRLPEPESVPAASALLTTDEKVTLFRRLFRGRTDVYPIRCWRMTAAISSRWISMTPIGAAMRRPLPNPVANWVCPSCWKSLARVTAPMHGYSSRRRARAVDAYVTGHRWQQGQAHRQDRHRGNAVALKTGYSTLF